MPFLVDSVGMALNRMGITAHMMLHTPLAIERSDGGVTNVTYLNQSPESTEHVAVFLIEIDRQSSTVDIKALEREIQSVLADVASSVNDWEAMSAKLGEMIKELPKRPFPGDKQELEEAINFLTYLNNHHFTLLGYRQYDLNRVEGDVELVPNIASSLGLMNKHTKAQPEQGLLLSSFSDSARKEALDHSLLILTKSSARAAYIAQLMSIISVSSVSIRKAMWLVKIDLSVYMRQTCITAAHVKSTAERKVQRVLDRSGLTPRSHDYKALLNILENLPRDELIQANVDDLSHMAHGVLEMQDRDKLKLFVRKDGFGRFYPV